MTEFHRQQRDYPVPIDDAARLTEMHHTKLRDLVRAGLLPCLMSRDTTARCGEWFNIDDLRKLHAAAKGLPDEEMDARRVHDTSDAVRAYLEANPPVTNYDRAIEQSWPVLARARSGRLFAHVRAEVVAEFAMHNLRDKPNAWQAPAVSAALKKMNAAQVRGIHPISGGPQRWHMWWRLPQSMWSASPELASLLESGLSAREDDEPLSVSRDRTRVYLRDTMRASDD